jgi:hypothetical protein
MACSSSREAWTMWLAYTTLRQVGNDAAPIPERIGADKFMCRPNCPSDCGTQPLRARRRLGSFERIRRNTILRSLHPHLYPQDKRWPIHLESTQQGHENGYAHATHLVQQSSTTRPWAWQSSSFVRTGYGCGGRGIPQTVCTRYTAIPGVAHEPAADFT